MLSRLKPILAIIVVVLLAVVGWAWFSQRPAVSEGWLGYVEGEAIYVAAPVSGALESLDVRRGDSVAAGARLFALNPQAASADTRRLQAAIAIAEARRADLLKARQRPEEIAIIRANQAQARANVERAQRDYDRTAAINAKGFATNAQLDAARATLHAAQAGAGGDNRAGTRRNAHWPCRRHCRRVGADRLDTRRTGGAATPRPRNRAGRRRHRASRTDVFQPRRMGAGERPVVSLLEPGRIKLRFFVPEDVVAKLRPGTRVSASCDGCGAAFGATVRYVAPRAEFTPPVIYSERARSKLVFMVEAAPDGDPARLHPGLPVEIRPVR